MEVYDGARVLLVYVCVNLKQYVGLNDKKSVENPSFFSVYIGWWGSRRRFKAKLMPSFFSSSSSCLFSSVRRGAGWTHLFETKAPNFF